MRFAIPPDPNSGIISRRGLRDWPLALRFLVLSLPAALGLGLVALWLGHQATSRAFHHTLESLPLMEAKTLASGMTDTMNELRHSLLRIAKDENSLLRDINGRLELYFHNNADLIQEIGWKGPNGSGHVFLRDTEGEFHRLAALEASQGPYSPFQQITAQPLHPGGVSTFPPVFFDDPTAPAADSSHRTPVMRMAATLEDGSGSLVLGINMVKWRNRMASLMQADSPLSLPIQQGALQLSFFFDTRGWILFEMGGLGSTRSFLPDMAREGYGGDLGRAGYDAAFRPWVSHHNYWAMVTEVAAGRSGSVPAAADKYLPGHVSSKGLLAYAPVLFSAQADQAPLVIGGIAFFETSSQPMAIFMRLANYTLGIVLAGMLLFLLLAWLVHRYGSLPFRGMVREVEQMRVTGRLAHLASQPVFSEQRALITAVNSLLDNAIATRRELASLSREIHTARERQPVDLDRKTAPKDEDCLGLVGSSSSIKAVREHIRKAARAGTDVLVWGETGTGKELVAAAIHKMSQRKAEPYVSINCGALDENLLLDVLFGHVKGAFSEAKTDRKGAFLAADGGTLHLDEIANASPKVQQSLLRALSVRRVRPLGTDEEVPFTTKVVAATNVDLRECVRTGSFREDLYYRLAIISIETPPLRHRKEDLPALAACFIQEAAASLGRKDIKLSRGALDLMYLYDWPGNVREFKNCITRALAFAEGDLLLPQHIMLEQDAFSTYARRVAAQTDRPAAMPAPADPTASYAERPPEQAGRTDEAPPEPAGRADGRPLPPALADPSDPPDRAEPAPAGTSAKPQDNKARPAQSGSVEGLNERQIRALDFIRKKGEITRPEYETVIGTGVSSRTAQNDLRELVERGILRRIGGGPGTRYKFDDAS